MSVVWSIDGTPLADLGLQVTRGVFRTGAASEMVLSRVGNFDDTPLFDYGQAVLLERDGTPYFAGTVKSRPSFASGGGEGQGIVIADAWQDLEDTVYLEEWSVGTGTFDFPIAMLGLNDEGIPIATGTQITEAVNFAIGAGVNLQLGSIPTGVILWPSEARNVSVAEVIRMSCRMHPDWVPWINHSTSPPTFNVTPRALLTGSSASVSPATTNVERFSITRRDDLVPLAVRITYANATIIDGTTYRDMVVDHYPEAGPTTGPRVLSSVIDLAGGQMQFQKSRIQTRTIPSDGDGAKPYLKDKFPQLAAVADAHYSVEDWDTELAPDDLEHPDPINPNAERLGADTVSDLPRELVRGTIEDWMRKKVGKVLIYARLVPNEDATDDEKKILSALAGLQKGMSIVATNAVTKIYKGVTQWVAPEEAPSGIAQAIYDGLQTYQFEGSATIEEADVTATRYHGTKFNLVGGGELSTMNAVVRSAAFDVEAGTVEVSVGPSPALSAQDFLDMQRMLRGRPVTWMFEDERTSNELGAENEAGSRGDTVSGYDQPETLYLGGGDGFNGSLIWVFYSTGPEGDRSSFNLKQWFTEGRMTKITLNGVDATVGDFTMDMSVVDTDT